MSDFKNVLSKQLDELTDEEVNVLFNAYDSNLVHIFADKESSVYADVKCVVCSELYYNNDYLVQQSVYKFSHRGESYLVKFYGKYESYVGETYFGWKFVEARQKVVTVYE